MPSSPYTPVGDGAFPNPLQPKSELNKPEYGLKVALAIYQSSVYAENSYYVSRNKVMAENRVFAVGKQPFQTYLDLLGVDGKQSFLNLDYHPRPIAPKFRDILVNDIMAKMENVDCTGLSLDIQKRKDSRKTEAAFKMQHGDFVKQLEEQSGMKFSSPTDDFTPENEDELQLWAQLNDKEKEELLMEEGINFILYNNDWEPGTKKLIAEDLVDTGLAGTKTGFDGRKRIKTKRIRPEYLIYGTTLTLNFKGVSYVGHLERISIVDVRAMYSNFPEEELWRLAYQYRGMYGNPEQLTDFIADYTIAYTRPYDDWLIDIMYWEYRVIKEIPYVKGTDRNDNPILDMGKSLKKETEKKKNYSIKIPTIYQGAWVIGSTLPCEWQEMPNLIRSNEDVQDVRFSYSLYMLNNNGDMLPVSPMKMIRSSIIQCDLAILRIQNVVALTPPPGFTMNVDSVMDLNLGRGMEKITFAKVIEMYRQTGIVPYSQQKISGNPDGKPPLLPLQNNIGNQIQEYVNIYNFEMNNIRDYLGINEVKDGSEVNPRLGLGVMQGQMMASNMATAHIYGGFVSIMTDTVNCIAIMLWDALNTPETNEIYIKFLGKENVDFIRYNKDITKSNYLTKISVNMSQAEMSWIDNMCITAVQQKQMTPDDAMMVKKFAQFDLDRGIRYLTFIQKKRNREMAQAQQQAQQQQAQLTMQQTGQQMKAKAAIDAEGDKRAMIKEDRKLSGQHRLKVQDLINQSLLLAQQGLGEVPSYVQVAIDKQLQGHILDQETQIEAMENALAASDLQMQQQVQQQAAQAQQGQQQQGQNQQQQQPTAA